MDTNASKTPDPLPFAAWQARTPAAAARELHQRVVQLPFPLRHAAVAWMKPEADLAAALSGGGETVGGALRPDSPAQENHSGHTAPPTFSALRGIPYFLKDL